MKGKHAVIIGGSIGVLFADNILSSSFKSILSGGRGVGPTIKLSTPAGYFAAGSGPASLRVKSRLNTVFMAISILGFRFNKLLSCSFGQWT